jgi:rfaE bifunctional protein kinase chain/domain
MGAEVIAVGRLGGDFAGDKLRSIFADEKIPLEGLFLQQNYATPVKNRIIAENQQIVRIDHEKFTPISELLEQQVIDSLPALLKGVKVVAISDYGKGLLSRTLLAAVIEQAKLSDVPVIADPKGLDFTKYCGATVIKPNLSELYAAASMAADLPLEPVAAKVLALSQAEALLVTRSEAGISLFYGNGSRHDFPVQIHEVKDVTGAGDTVLAMLACALGNELSLPEAIQLAIVAAGIAIERFGCARITLSDLARRLLQFDASNKVFDSEHLFALKEALKGRKIALLGLSGECGLTSFIFNTICRLGKRQDVDLLLYVRDPSPDSEFIAILTALHDVGFIILQEESLAVLCETLFPDELYAIEGNQLLSLSGVEQFLAPKNE